MTDTKQECHPSGHQWEVRPQESDRLVTRYRCTECGRWGHRQWYRYRPGKGVPVQPIKAYGVETQRDVLKALARRREREDVPFSVRDRMALEEAQERLRREADAGD